MDVCWRDITCSGYLGPFILPANSSCIMPENHGVTKQHEDIQFSLIKTVFLDICVFNILLFRMQLFNQSITHPIAQFRGPSINFKYSTILINCSLLPFHCSHSSLTGPQRLSGERPSSIIKADVTCMFTLLFSHARLPTQTQPGTQRFS